jgi:SAM-dependent methyltransferase
MSKSIVDYYTSSFNEHERHQDGFGQIQRERTLQILNSYLSEQSHLIADIGGATGYYAFELAKSGHKVHLIDMVPVHIEKAKEMADEKGLNLAGFNVGDARKLDFFDETFDAAILHGPLYHLTCRNERIKALQEAYRILKPRGKLFAFAINRYAGIFYGIHSGQILQDDYFKIALTESKSGYRRRTPGWHFHLPEEMRAEVLDAGFQIEALKGVVSLVWMLPDIEKKMVDKAIRKKIFEISRHLEDEPIIGQDFVCIAHKS